MLSNDASSRDEERTEKRDVEKDGDAVRRMVFFGDKLLGSSVAQALQKQRNDSGGDTMTLGELSTLFGLTTSNLLLASLLPRLLPPCMEAAVATISASAITTCRNHSLGTMVEAAIYLVHEKYEEGPDAVAEVGAFILAQARSAPSGNTSYVSMHHNREHQDVTGSLFPSKMRSKGTAKLDKAAATLKEWEEIKKKRQKRKTNQKAIRRVVSASFINERPQRSTIQKAMRKVASASFVNCKGVLLGLVAKGIKGALTLRNTKLKTAAVNFEATAWLDGVKAVGQGGQKRKAEQRAVEAVFRKLLKRDSSSGSSRKVAVKGK